MSRPEQEEGAQALPSPSPAIALVLRGRPRDLGGFSVRRTLPAPFSTPLSATGRRLVGPFIFFDHLGPTEQPPGAGMDVRPHPHISLATVTYLFSGEIFHRDSLGTAQAIRPRDVNWMTAGRGITHSERTAPEVRARGQLLHGIQAWVALPRASEECAPSFQHHPASALPRHQASGVDTCVIAGSAFGERSPVVVASPTLYLDVRMDSGSTFDVPAGAERQHEERAVYLAAGELAVDGGTLGEGDLAILEPGAKLALRATRPSTVMILGGARLDGERHLWWNFVSSSVARIDEAKRAWAAGEFARVPGDDQEHIPLPES